MTEPVPAIEEIPGLMAEVRGRFAHVETCPFEGERVFLESAGGALRLKSVIETSALHAGYPDNQGRANGASAALMAMIDRGRADMALFLGATSGRVFVGESGSEVLFRLIRTAALAAPAGGAMLGTTLEHPASVGAMRRWAEVTGRPLVQVPHDDATGCVTAAAYRGLVTPEVRVATIVHTSPVTGMAVDVAAVAREIRAVAPDAYIVVDGIQHASHGAVDLAALGVDGYAVSPYKVFSRHGYGVGWASDRLTAAPKERIDGGPADAWELGTRDSGAYATFSDVVAYLDWLGGRVSGDEAPRARIEAAAAAIAAQERAVLQAMLTGTGNLPGLTALPGIEIVGPPDAAGREGVIAFRRAGMPSADLVEHLRRHRVRVHVRKADHYSGNVLRPLGWADCVRVSTGHYTTLEEAGRFLAALRAAG